MFLSAYHFEGDPTALSAAHERLAATYPPGSPALHVCAAGEHGIVVIDACPGRADFEAFSQSAEFRTALAAVALPKPRIVPLGEVRSTSLTAGAVTS
jgi:hypothetical protein